MGPCSVEVDVHTRLFSSTMYPVKVRTAQRMVEAGSKHFSDFQILYIRLKAQVGGPTTDPPADEFRHGNLAFSTVA